MARVDEIQEDLVLVLLIALIGMVIWFYFKFKGLDPAGDFLKWLKAALQAMSNAATNAVNNLSGGSPTGPVNGLGAGGADGSIFDSQVFTGSSSSEAGLGLTPIIEG